SGKIFIEVRKGISSYSTTYLPLFLLLLLGFSVLFALATYISSGGNVVMWLRNASAYALGFSLAYIIALAIAYFITPELLRSNVMSNAMVGDLLSNLEVEQQPLAKIAITEGIIIIEEWLKAAIFHLLLVFCVLAVFNAAILGGSLILLLSDNKNSKKND
ncbi:MAG: hypothetical protein ACK4NX_01490, partial [Candidatus Paceibacteria bacterium]